VPIQCEYYALEGLGQLLRNVRLIQQNVNPELRLSGIVMTMFDARTKLSEQVVAEVRKYFGARVFDTVIPRTVRLSEAPGYGQPITLYDPASKGARTYRALAKELAERGPEEQGVPEIANLPTVIKPAERPPPPVEAAPAVRRSSSRPPPQPRRVPMPVRPRTPPPVVAPAPTAEAPPKTEEPDPQTAEPDAVDLANSGLDDKEPPPDVSAEDPNQSLADTAGEGSPAEVTGPAGPGDEPADEEPTEEAASDLPTPVPDTAEQAEETVIVEQSAETPPVTEVVTVEPAEPPSEDRARMMEGQATPSTGEAPMLSVDLPRAKVEGSDGEHEAPRKKFRLFRRGGEE